MMAIAPRASCSRSSAGSQKRRKSSLWGRTGPTDDRLAYVSFKNLRAEVSDPVYCLEEETLSGRRSDNCAADDDQRAAEPDAARRRLAEGEVRDGLCDDEEEDDVHAEQRSEIPRRAVDDVAVREQHQTAG